MLCMLAAPSLIHQHCLQGEAHFGLANMSGHPGVRTRVSRLSKVRCCVIFSYVIVDLICVVVKGSGVGTRSGDVATESNPIGRPHQPTAQTGAPFLHSIHLILFKLYCVCL